MPSYTWTLTTPTVTPGAEAPVLVISDEAAIGLPDWGYDITTLPDLDVSFTPRNDFVALADAYSRRLFTPRGLIWSDPSYGFDVRDFLNDEITAQTLQAIRAGCEAQAEQDERIASVDVSVSYAVGDETLRIGATLYTDAGPFSMVLSITDLTASIFVEV